MLYPLSYGGSLGGQNITSRSGVLSHRMCGVRAAPHRIAPYAAAVAESLGRVLVVDDSDVIRQLISVNLELEGFEVYQAVDGQDCLDRVTEVEPTVVTLDVVMPRLDGLKTAARLRADPRTAHVRIAMISACAQDSDVQRGLDSGVDVYLTKPFDPETLIRTVRELAGSAETADGQSGD